LSADWKE
jgi:hypothetical protein